MLPTYTTMRVAGLIGDNEYPGLEAWVKRCAAQFVAGKFEKANEAGVAKFGGLIKSKIAEVKA